MPSNRRSYHQSYMRQWRGDNSDKAKRQNRESARRRRTDWAVPNRPEPQHCECCGTAAELVAKDHRSLNLDHDHVTKKFRGWLCVKCNVGIGMLGDNLIGVLNAVKYLERNS